MQKQDRITYLLGAGASVGKPKSLEGQKDKTKMPIVGNFDQYFSSTKKRATDIQRKNLTYSELRNANLIVYPKQNYDQDDVRQFIEYLVENEELTEEAFSVDTLAKRYLFQGNNEKLIILKRIISCMMLEMQLIRGLDHRYEAFFASIMRFKGKDVAFPSNMNVLSWNYDLQFEESLYNINKASYSRLGSSFLNFASCEPTQFEYKKLNGIAGSSFLLNKSEELDLSSFKNWRDHLRKEHSSSFAISHFQKISEMNSDEIKFAWEIDIQLVKSYYECILKQSRTLVIIGYSFPNFNSEVDEQLIRYGGFQQIFIQCGKGGNDVKERLNSIYNKYKGRDSKVLSVPPEHIHVLDTTDEFYIPKSFEFTY